MTVNPLTGALAAIRYRYTRNDTGWAEADGKEIVPGLAIVPSANDSVHKTARYILVHVPSGYSFGSAYCGAHVTPAGEATAALTADWSLDREPLVAALKAQNLTAWSNQTRGCADWCEEGDGPKPASYEIVCKTCDWEYDEDLDGFVTTKEQADRIGSDHECEPWITVTAPTGRDTAGGAA